jgi:NAD(P)-dependent dehydrogenase (short-subunit alcohol dehydrogenase family)
MKDKIVAITGATSGLGRATALQLAQKGASVVIIARSNTKANQVIKEIERKGGKGQSIISDLSSMKDAKEAAVSITYAVKRLDVLINNAGAHFPKYIETSEGFESTLALNYLSPFLLTHHLMEQMEQTASEYGEARIINISSVMHKGPINWDDLNYKDTTYSSTSAYYQSKHLLTSFTYYLSRQLKETGITVNCIHPGFVKTALAQSDYPFPMNITLSNEVKGISGEYVHHRKAKKSWPPTRDENAQKRLYNVTQGMLSEWLTSRGRRRR